MVTALGKPSDKADRRESAPDSDSRSVEREGAQAAARDIVKRGAHAAAPAPQASLTASRQPPDSDSRSVVREGAQAAARDTVKRGAHAAAPAPQASLTVLRQPPDSDSRSVEREGAQAAARNSVKTGRSCCRSRAPSFADRVAAAVPPGCGKMRRLRRARRSVEFGTCDREGERWSAQP
jgi:hypothetical protein